MIKKPFKKLIPTYYIITGYSFIMGHYIEDERDVTQFLKWDTDVEQRNIFKSVNDYLEHHSRNLGFYEDIYRPLNERTIEILEDEESDVLLSSEDEDSEQNPELLQQHMYAYS